MTDHTDVTRTSFIGKPVNRVDGLAKVTGTAKYAGEFNVPRLLHGVVISSDIPLPLDLSRACAPHRP